MRTAALLSALALLACGGEQHGHSSSSGGHGGVSGVGAAPAVSGQAGTLPGRGGDGGASNEAGQSGSEAGGSGAEDGACGAPDLSGLSVFSSSYWDPLGYPPYALDGCNLVYVKAEAGGGALYQRDLATGRETLLEAASAHPRRPAIAGEVVAWELDSNGKSQVRIRYAGQVRDLTGAFDHAGEPRVSADALVFTGFVGPGADGDTDVFLYEPATATLSAITPGSGQQRFADVSHDYVAFTDFAEDPSGHFDEAKSIANVVLYERASGSVTVRSREGKQAFPLLGSDGALIYLDWGAVHPEPKFSQFALRAGRVTEAVERDVDLKGAPIHTNPAYVRPSLRAQNVDFVDGESGDIGLYRVNLQSVSAPELVAIAGSPQLLGPVATPAFTLIATRAVDQSLGLRAVPR